MKIVTAILGVLVAAAGVYCCLQPIATEVALADMLIIFIGIGMIIAGVGEIVQWNNARKAGMSDGWTLLGGVVSLICGIVLVGCNFAMAGAIYATMLSYIMAAWMILGGISRIGAALSLRKLGKAAAEYNPDSMRAAIRQEQIGQVSSNWILVMILGVAMIVAGVVCIASPTILIAFMGIIFGVSMVIAGISLISLAFAAPNKA